MTWRWQFEDISCIAKPPYLTFECPKLRAERPLDALFDMPSREHDGCEALFGKHFLNVFLRPMLCATQHIRAQHGLDK